MKQSVVRPVCFLILLSVLVYHNSLSNGFTFDDNVVIVENYYIKHPAWIPALWNDKYFDLFGEGSYRPLVSLTYFLDYFLWGLSAKGFHFTNLILHTINSCLLFIFFTRLFSRGKWIFFAALLFTVHPVMTESVNAIGFREELLVVLFTFSGLMSFLKACQISYGIRIWFYLFFSLLVFAAGLLSKENMLIYPFLVILVWLYLKDWKLEKLRKIELFFVVALLLVFVFYLYIRFGFFSGKRDVKIFSSDLWVRMTAGISIIGYYLKLILFPFPLSPDYTFPRSAGIELIRTFVTILALFWASWLFWVHKVLRFGWLWFLFALLPTLNVYPIANPLAERYLYLPSTGTYVIFGAVISRLAMLDPSDSFWKKSCSGIKILILLCFAGLTYDRNSYWKSIDTLWEKAYKVTPRSYKVLNSLGVIYNGREDYALAIQVLKSSLEINPNSVRTYSNLGLAYHKAGLNKLADETLSRGLQMDPANVYILINLAKVKIEANEIDEGLRLVERAIENQPFYAEPFLIKGNLYIQREAYEKAFEAYQAAAANRPDYPEPLINIGVLYGRLGQFQNSVNVLRRALLIDPANPVANMNLASAYYFLKDYGNAKMYAKIAIETGAALPEILLSLLDR